MPEFLSNYIPLRHGRFGNECITAIIIDNVQLCFQIY